MSVRVLLVEDNDVYRESLELLLAMQPSLDVVGSVGAGDAAAATSASVVCLTAEASPEEREEILRAGASALVEKGGSIEGLAEAILAAAR